ncbi:MAG: electron transfer flavoprotein subunit beta/FixA family protein [Euryarchaeota archaeon]|nr:electron transfer flavoprotein subunit beta/FixA family protein [Euryarchaeota archaeon]
MNTVVCIKQVPDTETKVKVHPQRPALDPEGVKWVISPYDELAIEAALRMKEKMGGTVTVVSMGPQRVEETLRTALAMGADSAVHIKEDLDVDAITVARILAKAIQGLPRDLVLVGKQAIDDDSGQVGPALGEFLGVPSVGIATKLEVAADKKSAKVSRQIEGAEENLEIPLPAVLSVQKGLNGIHEPRYPTLPNIMKAKSKPLKAQALKDLGLKPEETAPRTQVAEMALPPPRKAGKLIEYETPQEAAQKLLTLLREEAKLLQI